MGGVDPIVVAAEDDGLAGSCAPVTMRSPSGLRIDLIGVAAEDDGRGPVGRRGDDALAVGAERRRKDPGVVAVEDEGLAGAVGVPQRAVRSCAPVTTRLPSGLNAAAGSV
ncbi:hypothetical protein BE20_05780 [Sorangium cellulosum]|nr:hypothetical protein BE20_05780 [Sorangium cellulosum]